MLGLVVVAAEDSVGLPPHALLEELLGAPLLARAIAASLPVNEPAAGAVVVPAELVEQVEQEVKARFGLDEVDLVLSGGPAFRDALLTGLDALPDSVDCVLVQEAGRVLVPAGLVERLLPAARRAGVSVPAIEVNAPAVIWQDGKASTIPLAAGASLRALQGPAAFQPSVLRQLLQEPVQNLHELISAALRAGTAIELINGDTDNFLLGTAADVSRALEVYSRRAAEYAFLYPRELLPSEPLSDALLAGDPSELLPEAFLGDLAASSTYALSNDENALLAAVENDASVGTLDAAFDAVGADDLPIELPGMAHEDEAAASAHRAGSSAFTEISSNTTPEIVSAAEEEVIALPGTPLLSEEQQFAHTSPEAVVVADALHVAHTTAVPVSEQRDAIEIIELPAHGLPEGLSEELVPDAHRLPTLMIADSGWGEGDTEQTTHIVPVEHVDAPTAEPALEPALAAAIAEDTIALPGAALEAPTASEEAVWASSLSGLSDGWMQEVAAAAVAVVPAADLLVTPASVETSGEETHDHHPVVTATESAAAVEPVPFIPVDIAHAADEAILAIDAMELHAQPLVEASASPAPVSPAANAADNAAESDDGSYRLTSSALADALVHTDSLRHADSRVEHTAIVPLPLPVDALEAIDTAAGPALEMSPTAQPSSSAPSFTVDQEQHFSSSSLGSSLLASFEHTTDHSNPFGAPPAIDALPPLGDMGTDLGAHTHDMDSWSAALDDFAFSTQTPAPVTVAAPSPVSSLFAPRREGESTEVTQVGILDFPVDISSDQ